MTGRLSYLSGIFVFLLLALYSPCILADNLKQNKYRILVMHSYDEDFPSNQDLNRMIRENFVHRNIHAEFKYFYLDCEKYDSEEEIDRCYHCIDTVAKWKPDLVLANDDQVVYSALMCAHPLLREIPFVFAGVSFPNRDLLNAYPNVTGFTNIPDYVENIRMSERLLGPTRVLFYHDQTYLGKQVVREITSQLKDAYPSTYRILADYIRHNYNDSILDPLNPTKEILRNAAIQQEPDSTEILFPNFYSRLAPDALWIISGLYKNSVFFQTKYDYRILGMGRMAAVPAFSVMNEGVGYGQGILGGYFTPLYIQASDQVGYAARILAGENIAGLPVVQSSKKHIVDWVEMKRWNIQVKTIPDGYEIMNLPFEEKYRKSIILSVIIFSFFMLAIVSFLIWLYLKTSKEKREAKRNLLQEKELLSLSLEESNIFSWKYDEQKDVLLFDKEFFEALKLPFQEFKVQDMYYTTHPDERDFAYRKFYEVKDGILGNFRFNCRADFNGKGYVWYEFRFNNVRNKFNNNISVIGLIINVQDYKDREKELIRARDLAAQAELKESFVARISHEIRTPLNAIVGFSNLLASDEDMDSNERKEYVETINNNCDLLLKLINDILEISRIESGNLNFVFSQTNLTSVINDVFNTYYEVVPKEVSFIREIPDEPVYINADPFRLKQVITNLITNAIKFTHAGQIKIGYAADTAKNEIRIYVEDTGIGISEDEQKIIFDSFYKENEFVQGAGLGLSLSGVIIKKLGGSILLESALGKGSRFTVVLPYQQDEPEWRN